MPGESTSTERESASASRLVAGALCGIIGGALLPQSLQVGFKFLFPDEPDWGVLLWGEHWVLRVAASCLAAGGTGFVAGAIARHRGGPVGAVAATPATALWLLFAVSGWRERLLFLDGPIYVSIGNKLAATVIAVLLVPTAFVAGQVGEECGRQYGGHFDSQPRTPLGVKWYHYLWLPILIHILLAQVAWAGLYGFEWLKASWRAGPSMGALIPTMFVAMLWGTFILLGTGVGRAYRVLAGFERVGPGAARALAVIKYGIGFPILAGALQAGIMAIHYGLSRLFH